MAGQFACRQRFALRRMQARLSGRRELIPNGIERYGLHGRHVYFGYYDLTPFDGENDRLLAHSTPCHNRAPTPGEKIDVGFFRRGRPDEFQRIGDSSAWSRQQGCRLQWYPRVADGGNDLVLYNIDTPEGLGTTIRNTKTLREEARLPVALYDVAQDGSYGLSIDFHELNAFRPGYGYARGGLPPAIEAGPQKMAGLQRVDFATGTVTPMITLCDLIRIDPEPSMREAAHHLDHVSIAPDGSRFLFFHIWHYAGRKGTRVYIAESDGTRIRPLGLGSRVSHYAWIDSKTLLAYATREIEGGGYWLVDIDTGIRIHVNDPLLTEDGHPSVTDSGKVILTDTYPDPFGYQSLLLHDREARTTRILAQFYSPLAFRGAGRCDLHPRLSPDGSLICVDSARDGRRALYVTPVP